jgi:ketoreductase RED2
MVQPADLTGRACIVTGASSGIGDAIARRLDALGAGVVVNSATSVEAGEQLASELRDAVYVQGDIGDEATGPALVQAALDRWGKLDGLVNNAGRTVEIPLHDVGAVTVDAWDRILRTNVIGTFLVSQAALPAIEQSDDGWILNIGSIAGVRQTGSSLPYATSKAALHHMTTILAKVSEGVRINAIAPGMVETPWTSEWEPQRQFISGAAPLHRTAQPDDIADAALGVILSRYATGQIFVVDGGLGLVV